MLPRPTHKLLERNILMPAICNPIIRMIRNGDNIGAAQEIEQKVGEHISVAPNIRSCMLEYIQDNIDNTSIT